MALFAFALFPMADSGKRSLLTLALVLGQSVIHPMMYGPLAALYAGDVQHPQPVHGSFAGLPALRNGSGPRPAALRRDPARERRDATLAVSLVMAAFCALTLVSILLLGETSRQSLSDEPGSASLARR